MKTILLKTMGQAWLVTLLGVSVVSCGDDDGDGDDISDDDDSDAGDDDSDDDTDDDSDDDTDDDPEDDDSDDDSTDDTDAGDTDAGDTDAGDTDAGDTDAGDTDAGTDEAAFTLQLLHAADGEAKGPAVDDAPRFSAVLDALRSEMPDQTLVLSSGDNWIPGPFYSAGADEALSDVIGIAGSGRPDIAMMNAMGFNASALGNHEFDQGPGAIAGIIAEETVEIDGGVPDGGVPTWEGASFPYLSANLDFSADADLSPLVTDNGEDWEDGAGKIAASATITIDGETFGLVGATTPGLGNISSAGTDIVISPDDADDMAALAEIIQAEVDALTAEGINKIIVMTHLQQLDFEKELAPLLEDVDILIGGGSNSILADDTDRLRAGDEAADSYPIWDESPSGDPIAIVNTDGSWRYVGRLVIGFDEDGIILPETYDEDESGAYPADDEGVEELGSPEPIAEVAAIAEAIGEVLVEKESVILGSSTVYLDGRRSQVRSEETNLGNLTADANLWVAQQSDPTVVVSIKNGGGIRADIGEVVFPAGSVDPDEAVFLPNSPIPVAGKEEGDVSQFDIENTLAFNNGLVLLDVSASELWALMEHGVAVSAPGATPGRFPQVAGMRLSFDPNLPGRDQPDAATLNEFGQRVQSLVVETAAGDDVVVMGGALQGDANRTFRIVTLNFLANIDEGLGGDGYPFPSETAAPRTPLFTPPADPDDVVDLVFTDEGSEQKALADYLLLNFVDTPFEMAETPAAEDTRIQNLDEVAADTVISE